MPIRKHLLSSLHFYNLNWGKNERIPVEEVAERVNSPLKKYPANEESSVEKFGVNAKMFGVNDKSSETRFGEGTDAPKNTGKTAQKIIDFVISDSSMSAETMAYKIGISSRAVEKQIANCGLWVSYLVKVRTLVAIGALSLILKLKNKYIRLT